MINQIHVYKVIRCNEAFERDFSGKYLHNLNRGEFPEKHIHFRKYDIKEARK